MVGLLRELAAEQCPPVIHEKPDAAREDRPCDVLYVIDRLECDNSLNLGHRISFQFVNVLSSVTLKVPLGVTEDRYMDQDYCYTVMNLVDLDSAMDRLGEFVTRV